MHRDEESQIGSDHWKLYNCFVWSLYQKMQTKKVNSCCFKLVECHTNIFSWSFWSRRISFQFYFSRGSFGLRLSLVNKKSYNFLSFSSTCVRIEIWCSFISLWGYATIHIFHFPPDEKISDIYIFSFFTISYVIV